MSPKLLLTTGKIYYCYYYDYDYYDYTGNITTATTFAIPTTIAFAILVPIALSPNRCLTIPVSMERSL